MKARGKRDAGTIAIANVRRDGGTQIRAGLDEDTVQEYTDLIKAGVKFPPIGVYQEGPLQEGTPFWLWDGFHRVEAYSRAGVERVHVEFRSGNRRDALRAACGANADHGLKRSNADKRRAVETFLSDPEWQQWSDGAIAKETNVSRQTVTNIRSELAISPVGPQRVKGVDGRERMRPAKLCCNGDGRPVRPPSEVLCAECFAALDAQMQALGGAPKDSTSGQPTPVPPPAGNPTDGDEEGAGVPVSPDSAGIAPAAPAPDESRDRLINVERMLRDAQAEIGPLIATGAALDVLVALNDALAVVRRALEPASDFEVAAGDEPDAPIPYAVVPEVPPTRSGWPTTPVIGHPTSTLAVNGRMLRPGWAPCKGGPSDAGHVPYLSLSSGECSRCGRLVFVVGDGAAHELVIERDEDASL